MRATKLRHDDGAKLTKKMADEYAVLLEGELKAAGFITDVSAPTHTTLHLNYSSHACFVIDTDLLGYNYREDDHHSLVGWKRTAVPTWDQRVEFNDLLNLFLDRHKLKCNIKSGPYTVRTYENGGRTEWHWQHEKPFWQIQNEQRFGTIEKLTPSMEEEAKEKRREIYRERRKQKKIEENRAQIAIVNG